MPSSAVSGFQKDQPIDFIASWAPGAVASANRSSTSSSVTRFWLTTMVEMKALSDSRVALALKSISRWTPSVGSAWNRLRLSPPGPIRINRLTRSGQVSASRIAVPPPSELPNTCALSMPRWSIRPITYVDENR
jgi:hypothetical protein